MQKSAPLKRERERLPRPLVGGLGSDGASVRENDLGYCLLGFCALIAGCVDPRRVGYIRLLMRRFSGFKPPCRLHSST